MITDFIDENKVSSRSIRKDAVMCNEWIITSDSSFFKKLDNEEIKCFFETSKDFFLKRNMERKILHLLVFIWMKVLLICT